MQESLQHTWLVGALISLAAWLVIFSTLKGSKRKLLIVSFSVAAIGMLLNAIAWTVDWWHPHTVTGTRVGIEDALFALSVGGIGATFYEWFFRLRSSANRGKIARLKIILLVILPILVAASSSHLFSFSSFYGWLIAIIPPTIWMLSKRIDLIKPALFTATAFVIATFAGFWILDQLDPRFIDSTYQFENLSGWLVLGVPLEDLIWFFTIGAYLAIIHPFLLDYRLEKLKK